MVRLGLGITTYNRAESLGRVLDGVARYTSAPHCLVVAVDGSTDGTLDLLRRRRVPHVVGTNQGIAWNKNRALFYLHEAAGCDVVILLEDDTAPTCMGWEQPWIEAAERWGHANLAGWWFSERFLSGAGTPTDPILCAEISGQCVSFSRRALRTVGYMDTRFTRYGFEHRDHSDRLRRAGFGGDAGRGAFFLLKGDFEVTFEQGDYHGDVERSVLTYLSLQGDTSLHRRPWRNLKEVKRLMAELRHARPYDALLRWRLALLLASMPFRYASGWLARKVRVGVRRVRKRLTAAEPGG